MSSPLDDLMGNAITEHIVDDSSIADEDVQIDVIDDRPEEDRVEPRKDAAPEDIDTEIEEVGGRAQKRSRLHRKTKTSSRCFSGVKKFCLQK